MNFFASQVIDFCDMENIKTIPDFGAEHGPVIMLNLVKFKDKRVYFEEYIPAFGEVVKQLGIEGVEVRFVTEVVANIIADDNDHWDEVMLVEYPSAAAFKTIAESEIYQTIANPLRLAGTKELKLIMTRKVEI